MRNATFFSLAVATFALQCAIPPFMSFVPYRVKKYWSVVTRARISAAGTADLVAQIAKYAPPPKLIFIPTNDTTFSTRNF